uniref:Head closure Hc1 n=1 Tax=Cutibacterium phage vB_CacS-HV1 TaxID=3236917 RepID=A0AB39CF81_9CAUD
MTNFPYGETVVMLQSTVRVDDLGDRVEDWGHPVETVYHNVAIYASLSQEDEAAGRDTDWEHWSMLFKQPVKGADYRCRWRIRGVVWEADGSPMVWHHPMTGWDAGTQVNVKRKKG